MYLGLISISKNILHKQCRSNSILGCLNLQPKTLTNIHFSGEEASKPEKRRSKEVSDLKYMVTHLSMKPAA